MTTVVNSKWRDDNRLETLLLPLLVPVAIFGLAYIIYYTDALDGEIGNTTAQCIFVEKTLLNVSLKSVFSFLKGLETCIASKGCKKV
jgi:hypothetical protein